MTCFRTVYMFYVNDEPESKFLYTETIKLYTDCGVVT